ncbi:MAG: hypothetical protein AMK71_03800 [Nitrospira bacterium SG8_35_4]|nr:MAG: hypothetical protein AMK71_03800 [Nitrospira bacterium SG8_35_4]
MKKISSVISLLCLGFIWAGCGSGGGGGGGGTTTGASNPAPAPTLTESASGIWIGTVESTVAGSACEQGVKQCDMVGIVDENNVLRFYNVTTRDQYSGTVYGSGKTISSTITIYPVGAGSTIAAVQITGSVDDTNINIPKTMTLQYSGAGDTGSINLIYDPALYERQSLISYLSYTWNNSSDTLSITDNGNKSGTLNGTMTFDSSNPLYTDCPLTGSVTIIDDNFNVYAVDITISSCDVFDGSYQGLTSLSDLVQANDNMKITFYVSNSGAAIMAQLTR